MPNQTSAWQLINTVKPTGDDQVLVWDRDCYEAAWVWDDGTIHNSEQQINPTHWQSLPKPPEGIEI